MQRLNTQDPGFSAAFKRIVRERRESNTDVKRDVQLIIDDVRHRGDDALNELTNRLDRYQLANGWTISADECRVAFESISPDLRDALTLAASRITAYHQGQVPADTDYTDSIGARLGARWRAVDAAGLYVPGGRAAYPSSLLMNAIPAKVAGVSRLVITTPTPDGKVNPLVLAAAHLAGVDEIWRIGGAQAIAALAYGTQQIAPVDVIAGPGNAWVAEAKRQLYGVVGIDMVAGPSEILVIADNQNNPSWIAADLLSQAEHDPSAQSILITDDPVFADTVADRVNVIAAQLPTSVTATESWKSHGVIIEVSNLDEAAELANALAAEHVELAVAEPEPLFNAIRHAGSIFLGRVTPEAVGDYIAGTNHVLPTGRRARFTSGLSVLDFMKRTSFIQLNDAALNTLGPPAISLANAEGLPAHALSIAKRLDHEGPEQ